MQLTAEIIINHLWQSSCFALLAALLALVLRENSPKVRYWVWLSASLKFLVPLALLVSLGSVIPRPAQGPVSIPTPVFPNTLVQIAEPFAPPSYSTVPAQAPTHFAPITIGIVWALGFVAITFVRCRSWFRMRAALRASTPVELPIPVPAFIATGASEPGIVGFLRPALVLPAGMLEHLNARQLDAVLAHELCHVRRRDNAFAAVHMVVEAIFWFHPLVWWIGSRMVEERELACDEEVLRMGCEPTDYVQGILKVCQLYAESPLPCVSGVTGADVKRRLRAILAGTIARELTIGKKLVLAAIGLATLTAPIVIGVLNAPVIEAQNAPPTTPKFEVASIRPCDGKGFGGRGGPGGSGGSVSPGRVSLECRTLVNLIEKAYLNFPSDALKFEPAPAPIEGGPAWGNSDRYTINARAQGDASQELMQGPMLQALLEERFKLKIHRETRQVPVYLLTVAQGGHKLKRVESCTPRTGVGQQLAPGQPPICGSGGGRNNGPNNVVLDMHAMTLDEFANVLGIYSDRPVINETGVTGMFDFHMEYTVPDEPTPGAAPGDPISRPRAADDPAVGPSPLTVFLSSQRQLGLKLESTKGPQKILVIDSAEKPSEN